MITQLDKLTFAHFSLNSISQDSEPNTNAHKKLKMFIISVDLEIAFLTQSEIKTFQYSRF